jgi:hypothetical protein
VDAITKCKTFFKEKPTKSKLKKLEGLYGISIPSNYTHHSNLVELVVKTESVVVLRFGTKKSSMDVIKVYTD